MHPKHFVQNMFKFLILLASTLLALNVSATMDSKLPAKSAEDIAIGKECTKCHADETPGIVSEWKKGAPDEGKGFALAPRKLALSGHDSPNEAGFDAHQ